MRLVIALLMGLMPLFANAQDNYLNTTSKWQVYSSSVYGFYSSIFYIDGDTIIDGKELYRLYNIERSVVSIDTSGNLVYSTPTIWPWGGIREEDKKIYRTTYFENSGDLLYDFNLDAGDTISLSGGCSGLGASRIISQIDTFQFGSETRKFYSVTNSYGYYEGIGYPTGPLGPYCHFIDSGNSLICYSKDGNLFSLPSSFDCLLGDPSAYCFCPSTSAYFCGTVGADDYLVLGEILESIPQGQNIKVVEVALGAINTDTVFVSGESGVNCRDFIGETGDTVLFHLVLNDDGIFEDEGCGIHQLHYANDSLYGTITPEISELAYEDFINQIEECIDLPDYHEIIGTFRFWRNNSLLTNFQVHINNQASPTITDDYEGDFHYPFAIFDEASGLVGPITPSSSLNPSYHVTANDVSKLKRHLLGIELLNNPYQLIAADVNGSGTVTISDLIQIQRMVLDIINNFSVGKSWEFIPANYVFPDPNNPWQEPYPISKTINVYADPMGWNKFDFVAVKLGDVTGG